MSSILKALKKLENESPPQQRMPFWPQKSDMTKAINQRVRSTWLFNKLFYIFLIAITLTIAGWLVFNQQPVLVEKFFPVPRSPKSDKIEKDIPALAVGNIPKKPPVSIADTRKAPLIPADRSVNKESSGSERLQQKTVASQTPAKSELNNEKTQMLAARPDDEIRKPMSNRAAKKSDPPAPGLSFFDKKETNQPQLPQNQFSRPAFPSQQAEPFSPARRKRGSAKPGLFDEKAISQPGSTQQLPFPGMNAKKPETVMNPDRASKSLKPSSAIALLDDSRFELQAIAWSAVPEDRLAVVNGRILREGEAFDEYAVVSIGEEEIILQNAKGRWQLKFRLK